MKKKKKRTKLISLENLIDTETRVYRLSYLLQAFALVVHKDIGSIPRLLLLLCPITQLEIEMRKKT